MPGTARASEPTPTPATAAREADVRRMERWLGGMLASGVWLSVALVTAGVALALRRGDVPAAALLRPTGRVTSPAWLLADLAAGGGTGLIVLGLFVLIATPVLRVAASAGLFARQGDRLYAVITTVVLALLLGSFLLGTAAG
jgi:uncharacterized membrane protein